MRGDLLRRQRVELAGGNQRRQRGVFYYGRVIAGLAIREGTKDQYPLYDSLAMGVQVVVFTYLPGRTDELGRSLVEIGAEAPSAPLFEGVNNQPL